MLPGISGSLLASAFLEDVLPAKAGDDGARLRPTLAALHRWWHQAERQLGPASSLRAVLDIGALPLIELLGFTANRIEPHGEGFIGTLGGEHGPAAALRTTLWGVSAESAWRETVRAGRVAGVRWGLVYNGCRLRLVDAARPWSRRCLDFDLAIALADERSASAFRSLVHRRALADQGRTSLAALVEQSDAHGDAVCVSLGHGVLEALTALLNGLDRRTAPTAEGLPPFEQAVTLVYRLLFLLFAEARALVPTWHHVYREAYTIDALCRRVLSRRPPIGLWTTLQAISRLAHSGCRAGDLIVTPFNGRLFSPRHTPLGERGRVADEVVARAVLSLATRTSAAGRRRISYADLDVEQLGAVYERVLEYQPSRAGTAIQLTRTCTERKQTGSFYTPRSMTDFLVRRSLQPLIAGRSAEAILRLRVLDPAMGSGAFLVAACRYLATAAEQALVREGEWRPDDSAPTRRAELRRAVAQRCLYGVDSNPTAVQLARLSLWLTTLASERPLTFLDHHVVVGDSLLGAGFHDLARHPASGRRRQRRDERTLPLFGADAEAQMARHVLPDRFRLASDPDDTPGSVREKERALAALSAPGTPLSRWKTAADVWCASWFRTGGSLSAGTYGDVLASLVDRPSSLRPRQHAAIIGEAATVAQRRRFFHWELEFPEVFFDAAGRRLPDGGFDAVIGNPPWDVLRADSGDARARARARDGRRGEQCFFRDAGVYRHQGTGHANRYQQFLERVLQLARPGGGRIGMILPSGLATDRGSTALRRALLDSVHIDRLLGFDNRRGIFPIHRDIKFLLLTATNGSATERMTCCFGRSRAEWLDELPDAASEDPPEARPIVVSRALLASWDRENLVWPLLQHPIDLDILAHAAGRAPRLDAADGWAARFGRELNATEDRAHFVALPCAASDLLTVVEGKCVEPFRLRSQTSATGILASTAAALLDPATTFRRWRLAYRDVASATNMLTLIAALLPPGVVSTHTLFCLKPRLGLSAQYCLLSLLNSLVANYLVRLQVTTHVTTALMARLPVPRPANDDRAFHELASLARSLERIGLDGRDEYARLNALVAHLYGLTLPQYTHVVHTFPLLPETLRNACLRSYVRATETRTHGED